MSFTEQEFKRNAVDENNISEHSAIKPELPQGGGAISGIGEKFSHSEYTGTGSLNVPLQLPKARGLEPELSIHYDSTLANGVLGAGWKLNIPNISRKTEKGLPKYDDENESDEFIFSGAEELVPDVSSISNEEGTQTYRPRIEGIYSQIEFRTNRNNKKYWLVRTRDNVTHVFGLTSGGIIASPDHKSNLAKWLLEATFDDRGNAIIYEYLPDNGGIPNSAPGQRYTNQHIGRIVYGNTQPFFLANDEPFEVQVQSLIESASSDRASWCFSIYFDYGQHSKIESGQFASSRWILRQDPFSNFRFGFNLRTQRLCQRILIHHNISHEDDDFKEQGYSGLTSGYEFDYHNSLILTKLSRITRIGFRRVKSGATQGDYVIRRWPSLDLNYTEIREPKLSKINLPDFPSGFSQSSSAAMEFLDLDGEGIPGLVFRTNSDWYYSRNLGGRMAQPESIQSLPVGLKNGRFMDLAGNARMDYVQLSSAQSGYFERTSNQDWGSFHQIAQPPAYDPSDPKVKFIDLNGDGLPDMLISEEDCYLWQLSQGEFGYQSPQKKFKPLDDTEGPRCVFQEKEQCIFLADMSGDGLNDIVRIRNGEVCYWPNLGYGKFGGKILMGTPPVMDSPEHFEPDRIRLADVDGSGITDIIYLGREGCRYWANQAGNSWGHAIALPYPIPHQYSQSRVVDYYGKGTSCLIWSSDLAGDQGKETFCLDLTGGNKPHLLESFNNNLGAETKLSYKSSTQFYLKDAKANKPWITQLPMPVHVVDRIEVNDRVSGSQFVSRFAYHHGYYDGQEREFRGFGMVEKWDSEDYLSIGQNSTASNVSSHSDVPPVRTRTWYHHGAWRREGSIEREFKREYWQGDVSAHDLDDTILPSNLSIDEEREACRTLRGKVLRIELYADDATPNSPEQQARSKRPYQVQEKNYSVRLVQNQGTRKHPIFAIDERASVTFDYERLETPDPRIKHHMTLAVNAYGQAEKTLEIYYRRRYLQEDLSKEERQSQSHTTIRYKTKKYTNAIASDTAWRTPKVAEEIDYELAGLGWSDQDWLAFATVQQLLQNASQAIPEILPSAESIPQNSPTIRRIAHQKVYYRRNDLRDLAALGELQSMGLPGERLQLALTNDLLDSFDGRVDRDEILTALRKETTGYVEIDDEVAFWIPSEKIYYSPSATGLPRDAQAELKFAHKRFFQPHKYVNAFGYASTATYDDCALRIIEVNDAASNQTLATYDYRVLEPRWVIDANKNHTQVAYDTLGLACATAILGKDPINGEFGDNLNQLKIDLSELERDAFINGPEKPRNSANAEKLLGNATSRIVYDVNRWQRTASTDSPKPAYAAVIQRRTFANGKLDSPSAIQPFLQNQNSKGVTKAGRGLEIAISFSDGFDREIQRKQLAPPRRTSRGTLDTKYRWHTTGWSVFNNKGKPIREYEPSFDRSPEFRIHTHGVSPILFYDPLDRVVSTLRPDGSWEKAHFHPWQHITWDGNDTLDSDPKQDPDVGGYFQRLKASDIPKLQLSQETLAKTRLHQNTPTTAHFDVQGREYLSIQHNRIESNGVTKEEWIRERTVFDLQGNRLAVIDSLEREAMLWQYDLAGRPLYQAGIDGGKRWFLEDAASEPLQRWDDRGQRFRYEYDILHRPKAQFVRQRELDPATGAPMTDPVNGDIRWKEYQYEYWVYGDDPVVIQHSNHLDPTRANLREEVWRHYDTAGLVEYSRYNILGQATDTWRRLLANYRITPDWASLLSSSDDIFEDASETRRALFQYDLQEREVAIVSGEGAQVDNFHTVQTHYDLLGHIFQRSAYLQHLTQRRSYTVIADIDYNEKGDLLRFEWGNNPAERVIANYDYDPRSFRLERIRTLRGGSDIMQDLKYDYDPVGNLSSIEDSAQQRLFYRNAIVEPKQTFHYDPLYRLIEATGREHIGQNLPPNAWDIQRMGKMRNNCKFTPQVSPADGRAMRPYKENYRYDSAGNLEEVIHQAGPQGSWRRRYRYEQVPGLKEKQSNRLLSTTIGQTTSKYRYDDHGNMVSMPHLQRMENDFRDQLRMSQRTATTCSQDTPQSTGERTYYVYDASGERMRKVTEKNGKTISESHYFGVLEKALTYNSNGQVTAELNALHVEAAEAPVVIIETDQVAQRITAPRGFGPRRRRAASTSRSHSYHEVRGQLLSHLKSSQVEFDFKDDTKVITYEEYYPYGSTAFAAQSDRRFWTKRKRFCGKERDGENGLNYHSARYYATWLGRWTTVDPSGVEDGLNPFVYVKSNPVRHNDNNGRWAEDLVLGIPSLIMGAKSLVENIKQGNVKDAIIDGIGVAADAVAIAVPGVPGGVGLANKAARAAVKVTQKADKVADAYSTVEQNIETVQEVGENIQAGDFNSLAKATGSAVGGSVLRAAGGPKKKSISSDRDRTSFRKKRDTKKSDSEDGIVYLRKDQDGGEYVGRAKNQKRYNRRQQEHTDANPDSEFEFEELERVPLNSKRKLEVAEEDWIRAGGGPTNKSNPKGGLQNKRHAMSEKRYRKNKGDVD